MRDLSKCRMFAGLVTAFCMTLSTWVSPTHLMAAAGCFYDVNGNAYSLQPNYAAQPMAAPTMSYQNAHPPAQQLAMQQQYLAMQQQANRAAQQPNYANSQLYVQPASCCGQPEYGAAGYPNPYEYGYEPYAYPYAYAPPPPCAPCADTCCWSTSGLLIAAAVIGGICGLAAGCLCGGKHGRKGDVGPIGPQGLTGPVGPQGLTGPAGTPGIPGPAGFPGLPGLPGTPGVAGFPGLPGLPGEPGEAGEPGVAGVAGTAGVAGLPGVAGTAGLAGLPGVAGTAGVAGLPGVAGTAGVAGLPGVAGTAGLAGLPGVAGTAGVAGLPGVAGTAGVAGLPGLQGVPGTPGQNGQDGTDGADGSCCCGTTTMAGQVPVESVFRFESTMAPPGVTGSFRGVVITPDNQVLTTAPIQVSSMGIQSETLVVKAPADAKGSYRVVFMADQHTAEGSTLGNVEVSTGQSGQVMTFAPTRLINSAGDQVSFDFSLQR